MAGGVGGGTHSLVQSSAPRTVEYPQGLPSGVLEQSGVLIPPTVMVRRADVQTLSTILAERAWERAVVKPAVSANAFNTFRVTVGTSPGAQQQFEHLIHGGDILVQALMAEIYDEGELSLVFLDGDFSHAIRKRPRSGDFLVQESRGGKWVPVQVDRRTVEQAALMLDIVTYKYPLYTLFSCASWFRTPLCSRC